MSLHKKMAHGALWSLLEKGGQQGLSFVVFMVLARLVGPEEYGLANICFIYFSFAGLIVYGLVDGIVCLQIEDDLRLSSIFWAIVVLGILLSLFCVATAAPLANYMGQPRLKGLLYWFSIVPFLVALSSVPNMLLLKSMSFKIYAIRTLAATFIGGVVGLAMAFNGAGAYAIVAQQIALFVVTNAVVWPSAGWRPKRTFQLRGLIKDIKPGFELMCSNVLGFLEGEFPRFIIGRFLGPTSLGHYAFVIRLRYALANALIIPPLAVLYPAFTKINDDKEEQRAIAGKIILLFGMILFPALAIAIATAPLYVPLLFGKIWTPTIPLLQIFIFGLCYWPFQAIVFQLFRAHGRMRIYLTVNAVSVLASIIMTFLIFLPNGLKLMAIGVVAFMSVMQAVFLIILQRQLDINLWKYVMNLWPSAVTALCVFVVMEFFNQSGLFLTAPWVKLLVLLLLGSATGVLGTLLLQRKLLKDALRFGRELLKKTDDSNTVLNAAPCFECEKNV